MGYSPFYNFTSTEDFRQGWITLDNCTTGVLGGGGGVQGAAGVLLGPIVEDGGNNNDKVLYISYTG